MMRNLLKTIPGLFLCVLLAILLQRSETAKTRYNALRVKERNALHATIANATARLAQLERRPKPFLPKGLGMAPQPENKQ